MRYYKKLFNDFLAIKMDNNLIYYDTHVHPKDVFGLCDSCEHSKKVRKPSLLEYFQYNDIVLYLLEFLFIHFPSYILGEIKKYFPYKEESVIESMNFSGIDKSTIVPIYPHAKVEDIYRGFSSDRFIRLGSIDINNIPILEIENQIIDQINNYSISGLKLHPNIQCFYPEPSLNDESLKEKLILLYSILEKYKLYLLIHGGLSYIPTNNHFTRSEFGLIKNFFDLDGNTFLENIKVPVIIAHLGLYNIKKPSFDEIKLLMEIDDIYFDTAGISPNLVRYFIEEYGHKKIIFGSDAPYFNLEYNIYLILKAIKMSSGINFKNAVSDIFSLNYEKVLHIKKR